ncbi:uncharacterized protein FIESC28_09321 [Fusarium coffeatum]|uniref:DUF676 domain-containing protein n=1 Tax=Fusarium coffeatum TaxID=231269 RepID=A0A366R3D8_9HYPO|nr:uncharacterized protein FIESC28_09321 [Fusarium coffeatum]RBR10790.1 hypothetical protein FIESC28_09321 [Fusarium coffeatum]
MLVDFNHWIILAIIALCTFFWFFYAPVKVAHKSASVSGPNKKYRQTHRIRGIPLEWDAERLKEFLVTQKVLQDAVVCSLAIELQGTSRSATTFLGKVTAFTHIPLPSSATVINRPATLSFDQEFLGITTISSPNEEDHKLDVIAIPGLGGHAFGSFRERDGEHMWLRDDLPYDLTSPSNERSMARIMTYGYKSVVAESDSIQNIEDIATQLVASLRSLDQGPKTKPIIFIAHSLGGIVVKQSLVNLAKSTLPEDSGLLQAVYGIAFFGVPHLGMDISSLISMAGDAPSRALVESLSRDNSQVLGYLQREFVNVLGPEGKSEVVSFYEDKMSPTAIQDSTGRWKMDEPLALLVSKASATHCRPWENSPEHICAISRPHSGLVKYAENDHEYDKVRIALRGLARRAVKGHRKKLSVDTHFIVPYIKNNEFIGRKDILQQLQYQHGFDKRSTPFKAGHKAYLYGLGGVGKTQIALAYAHSLQDSNPDISVYWVNASNAEQFHRSFLEIAQRCQVPDHDKPETDILATVQRWLLNEYKQPWLMIVDNADDTTMFFKSSQSNNSSQSTTTKKQGFASYLPSTANSVIIITTRNKKLGERFTRSRGHCEIKVDEMQDDEAEALLRTRLPEQDYKPGELFALASRLEKLPLALVQAAAFMKAQSMSTSRYLEQLKKGDRHLMIETQHTFAGELLSLMGFLGRVDIPEKFLLDYQRLKTGQPDDEDSSEADIAFECALGTLKAFSLVAETMTGNLSMHRLWKLGKYEEGKELAVPLIETMQRALGDEHRLTLNAMNTLALIYQNEHNLEESQHLFERVLQTQRKLYGDEDCETLAAGNNLATVYRERKLTDEAQTLHLSVVAGRERVLGLQHPETLVSMNNLASCYYDKQQLDKSEEILVKVRGIQEDLLGKEHPDTLRTTSNIATLWYKAGRLQEAIELMEKCVEGRRLALGHNHSMTLEAEKKIRSWKDELSNSS